MLNRSRVVSATLVAVGALLGWATASGQFAHFSMASA